MVHYDDEKLKRFLLGDLPTVEAEELEVAIATNVSRFERLCDVECELVADYLANRLTASDAKYFEQNFLITEPRVARLRMAAELQRISRGESVVEVPSTPRFRYAAAAAGAGMFALVVGGSFLYMNRAASPESDAVAAVREDSVPAISVRPDEPQPTVFPTSSPRVATVAPTSPVKTAPSRPPIVATTVPTFNISLSPGGLRGESEQVLKIPSGVKTVTINLRSSLPVERFSEFNIVVRTPDNEIVAASDELSSPRFSIDAVKLENRTYVISLEGVNENQELESIADYTFRVRR